MKKAIYYFTGTGNSMQIAHDLSKRLEETTIHAITKSATADFSAEVIGFVFPVYLWGVPDIVLRFIEKVKINISDKYFFAIATYKVQTGDVIGQLQRKLKNKGGKLSAGFTVPMPGNNIIFYELEPKLIQEKKLNECQSKLSDIAQIINLKQNSLPKSSLIQRILFTGLLHPLLTSTFNKADKQFWVESSCKNCGVCERVCPAENIKRNNGHPEWQHNCQLCLACINSCPNKAIQFKT